MGYTVKNVFSNFCESGVWDQNDLVERDLPAALLSELENGDNNGYRQIGQFRHLFRTKHFFSNFFPGRKFLKKVVQMFAWSFLALANI
jgi:hypothetical protein